MIYIIFERKFNEHCLQDIVERLCFSLNIIKYFSHPSSNIPNQSSIFVRLFLGVFFF